MFKGRILLISSLIFLSFVASFAQPITGIWRGKVSKGAPPFATTYKVEVKIIRQGDSLTGTSYYYASPSNYYRYAIKGYLDAADGSLHWWDDVLLEKKGGASMLSSVNGQPLAMQTDFNCPGSGIMKLDGQAETKNGNELEVHLDKQDEPLFADGWDELIENWLYGGSHPDLIAEAEQQQRGKKITEPADEIPPVVVRSEPAPVKKPTTAPPADKPTAAVYEKPATPIPPVVEKREPPRPQTTQEKFDTRQRIVQTTIPLAGDSIELQFFDNAEIDGDSISLFLNGCLIFEHVKLSAEPFVLKLAVQVLPADAELSMVAENLGAIPPNTSFMMAYVNGQRYTARLESTEGTTAVIRFVR